MKINSSSVNNLPATSASRPAAAGRQRDGGADKTASNPIQLSSAGREMARLEGGDADINPLRVAEIRDALDSGTLKISPERIADGLINSARELLSDR